MPTNSGIPVPADVVKRAAAVSAEGSFELKSRLYTDPAAYSFYIQNNLLNWRYDSAGIPAGFNNKLDYIQALLRGTGYSKGTSQRGVLDTEDISALKKVSGEALANGVDFLSLLESAYKTGTGRANQTTFSKSIATSIRLKDAGDAKKALSDGYYTMFGQYPAQQLTDDFMNQYNAEAKRQTAKTVTKTTSTTTGTGTSTKSATEVAGEGFTEAEQADFLANYLVKNFNFEKQEGLGGAAKALYDEINQTYRNNYITQPEFSSVVGILKDVLSTGDSKIAQQKIDTVKAQIRQVASKQFAGAADLLSAGSDLSALTVPMAQVATKKFGKTVNADDPIIKKALNYKDEKGNIRVANDLEFDNILKSDPRYAVSPTAINSAVSLADKIRAGLGR